MTLEAPAILKNYSIFYTDNLTVTNFSKSNPKTLQLYIPRFAQGDGSVIGIRTFIDTKANKSSSNYFAYAAYDQGSIKQGIRKPLSLVSQFLSFLYSYWIPLVLIVGAIIALLVAWNARRIKLELERIQQRHLEELTEKAQELHNKGAALASEAKKSDIIQLLETIVSIRRSIKDDILSKEYWWLFYALIDKKAFDKYLLDSPYVKASDYMLFDDFWHELNFRNSYVKAGQIDENILKKHN